MHIAWEGRMDESIFLPCLSHRPCGSASAPVHQGDQLLLVRLGTTKKSRESMQRVIQTLSGKDNGKGARNGNVCRRGDMHE